MPTLKEHAERTRRLFGDSAEEIHKWIDEYAGKVAHHRRFRHSFDNSTLTELELLCARKMLAKCEMMFI